MSLTIEGNPDDLLNQWPFLIDTESIRSVGVAWLFKEDGEWRFLPRITEDRSLFYNAIFFVRFGLPFLVAFSFRWSADGWMIFGKARALFQFCIGWKLNGRISLNARIQNDATSAEGVTGPNYGQATGFNYGTH